MNIILKNVNLFNPLNNIDQKNISVLLKDGVITKIGAIELKEIEDAKVYELNGMYVVPGFVDMHVHLREPGREDEETIISGSEAAVAGGFTSICCMPNTDPPLASQEKIKFVKERDRQALCHVYPIGAVS